MIPSTMTDQLRRRFRSLWVALLGVALVTLYCVRNAFSNPMGGQNLKVLVVLVSLALGSMSGLILEALRRKTRLAVMILVAAAGLYILFSVVYLIGNGPVLEDLVGIPVSALFIVLLLTLSARMASEGKELHRE